MGAGTDAPSPPSPTAGGAGAPRALAPLLAATALVAVAAIYLAQPLLPFIGDDFGAGTGPMAAVHAALQIAFGVGLTIFGVAADVAERRRLLTWMVCGLAGAAALAAAAPAYPVFLVACLAMGASAAVLPVLIAVAASARDPRALLWVLSAAPAGMVAGRVVAGLLGAASWRAAFGLAAVAAAGVAVVARRGLPRVPPAGAPGGAGAAIRQMAALLRNPVNVLLNVSNALVFLGWSAVWTILSFLLEDPPYGFGALQIGLIALIGIGGAVSGQIGARLAAAFGEGRTAAACLVIGLAAALAVAVSDDVLWALLAALFVHNAVAWILQAVNVPAAARRAGEGRAARGTALLYLTNFICTGVGALVGAVVWDEVGWGGVGLLAAGCCAVALALDAVGRSLGRRVAAPAAGEAPAGDPAG
ncbi:MAG: MFS transporter [Thermoleophilia bacterium]